MALKRDYVEHLAAMPPIIGGDNLVTYLAKQLVAAWAERDAAVTNAEAAKADLVIWRRVALEPPAAMSQVLDRVAELRAAREARR